MTKHVLDTFRLDAKVALVTGGARGLGQTMARALAEAGADIALTGRSIGPAAEAASAIASATGRHAKAFVVDVTVARDAGETDIEAAVLALEAVERALEGRVPKKVIVVPQRIVNVVA